MFLSVKSRFSSINEQNNVFFVALYWLLLALDKKVIVYIGISPGCGLYIYIYTVQNFLIEIRQMWNSPLGYFLNIQK